jgi:hypothetical protein
LYFLFFNGKNTARIFFGALYAIMQASYAVIMHYCTPYFTGVCCIYSTLQLAIAKFININ